MLSANRYTQTEQGKTVFMHGNNTVIQWITSTGAMLYYSQHGRFGRGSVLVKSALL